LRVLHFRKHRPASDIGPLREQLAGHWPFTLALLFVLTAGSLVWNNFVRLNGVSAARARPGPRLFLWCWERPEDLRFINKDRVGIAFRAKTVRLRGERVDVRPRLQPLRTPDKAWMVAVARIESDSAQPPLLNSHQADDVVRAVKDLAQLPGVQTIQLDFDARASERVFYREGIERLRRALRPSMEISMTALASWCMGDNWIADLPVDEIVPMLFQMGPDGGEIVRRIEEGNDFRASNCRSSVGIAVEEPVSKLRRDRRVYVFQSRAWKEQDVDTLLRAIDR
jgi:hypothetical protein